MQINIVEKRDNPAAANEFHVGDIVEVRGRVAAVSPAGDILFAPLAVDATDARTPEHAWLYNGEARVVCRPTALSLQLLGGRMTTRWPCLICAGETEKWAEQCWAVHSDGCCSNRAVCEQCLRDRADVARQLGLPVDTVPTLEALQAFRDAANPVHPS